MRSTGSLNTVKVETGNAEPLGRAEREVSGDDLDPVAVALEALDHQVDADRRVEVPLVL
ncbi:MAG: hypothetical protein GX643_15675, partial [Acidimicrobiales bacterium]|nr:hypothetical protein [Acidimicrobiales bacterium]